MINHHVYGSKNDPLVVFTHGIGEHSGLYLGFKDYLVQNGFSVLLYDLRGHGESESLEGFKDYKVFINDLHDLIINNRKKGQKVFLIGQSLGAIISNAYLTYQKDIDGIISMSYQYRYIRKVKYLGFIFPNKVLKLNWRDPRSRHEKKEEDILDVKLLKQIEFRWLYQTLIKANQRVHKTIKEQTTPILVLHGGADRIVEPNNACYHFEQSVKRKKDIIIYPNSKHDLLLDIDQTIVYKDIVDWLKGH